MLASFTTIVEEIKCDDSPSSPASGKHHTVAKASREFLVHYASTEDHFMRLSWISKFKFLNILLNDITRTDAVKSIATSLYSAGGKLASYSSCLIETDFLFDKIPIDHGRMIYGCNQQWFDKDRIWFGQLDYHQQVMLIIGMFQFTCQYNKSVLLINFVRRGGGALEMALYKEANKLYLKLSHKESVTSGSSVQLTSADRRQASSVSVQEDIECQNQRKLWNKTIGKYRQEIERRHKTEDNVSESKKKETSKKKSKVSKKDKNDGSVDWIQLLPITTVKKILNYLDPKTLKKMKRVDSYWNYVITDLLVERKTRKSLDKTIKKMNLGLVSNINQTVGNVKCERISWTEKRINKCVKRCAIDNNLRFAAGSYNEDSILTSAMLQRAADYSCPLYKLTTYPRFVPQNGKQLYAARCIVKDVNLFEEFYCASATSTETLCHMTTDSDWSSYSDSWCPTNIYCGDE